MARVLVLDDEGRIRTLVRRILERMGHEVVEAESGAEALVTLSQDRFDLLITDMHMPQMIGSEVIARARQDDEGLRVLLISGSAGAHQAECFGHGASGVVAKPFGVPELMAAVEAVLL